MFYSRSLNSKTNRFHERCLTTIYNDKQSNLEDQLVRDNSVSLNHQNTQHLAIQMYMVANDMYTDIMSEIFQLRENIHYHLRHTSQFMVHPIHSVYNRSESASYLGPQIWKLTPQEITAIEFAAGFKEKNKKWRPNDCSRRLFKVLTSNVGFI